MCNTIVLQSVSSLAVIIVRLLQWLALNLIEYCKWKCSSFIEEILWLMFFWVHKTRKILGLGFWYYFSCCLMVVFCSVGFFETESFLCAYQNSDACSMCIYQAAFGVISLTASIGLCSALEDAAAVGMATVHFYVYMYMCFTRFCHLWCSLTHTAKGCVTLVGTVCCRSQERPICGVMKISSCQKFLWVNPGPGKQ